MVIRWKFRFQGVGLSRTAVVDASNLEHYRTLLLLVVRGIREPREVFVNCLEAGV